MKIIWKVSRTGNVGRISLSGLNPTSRHEPRRITASPNPTYALPAIALAALLTGCVTVSEPQRPELTTPEQYSSPLTLTSETDQSASEPWWQGFNDSRMNDLIETALSRNLDIGIAMANLEQARQLDRAAAADLLPRFDAFVEAELTSVLTGNDTGTDAGTAAGGLASYDVSLGRRDRYVLQAAQARFRAAALSVADVRRLTATTVARQVIARRRAIERLSLLDTTLELQQRTLSIVKARLDAGIAPALDVDRVRADQARSRAQRGLLQASQREAEFALSVLTGQAPTTFPEATDEAGIPEFAAGPPLGIPADLLRQRPDLRAAEERFLAEAATVSVQRADLYPTLRLPGMIQLIGSTASGGVDGLIASLTAALDIPLFDGGRRRAEVAAQRAAADAALLGLRAALLEALAEVENALQRLQALEQQRKQLALAVKASRSAYRQLDALYTEGLVNFIDVLDAQRNLISSREALIDAEADAVSAIVTLYNAIGPNLSGIASSSPANNIQRTAY